jgi:regulator of replication initiation timing
MTTPAWLLACSKEAEKGFDPHVLSYHMGWVAAMNNANAEIFAIRQSVFDLVTERDALKAELSCLRNQGAELAALKKELEALSKMSRKPYPSAMPLGQERDQILRALGYADAAQRPSETKLRN